MTTWSCASRTAGTPPKVMRACSSYSSRCGYGTSTADWTAELALSDAI